MKICLDKVDEPCFGRRMTEQDKNEGRDSLGSLNFVFQQAVQHNVNHSNLMHD